MQHHQHSEYFSLIKDHTRHIQCEEMKIFKLHFNDTIIIWVFESFKWAEIWVWLSFVGLAWMHQQFSRCDYRMHSTIIFIRFVLNLWMSNIKFWWWERSNSIPNLFDENESSLKFCNEFAIHRQESSEKSKSEEAAHSSTINWHIIDTGETNVIYFPSDWCRRLTGTFSMLHNDKPIFRDCINFHSRYSIHPREVHYKWSSGTHLWLVVIITNEHRMRRTSKDEDEGEKLHCIHMGWAAWWWWWRWYEEKWMGRAGHENEVEKNLFHTWLMIRSVKEESKK